MQIDTRIRKAIEDIIPRRESLKDKQKELTDDIKALALAYNVKPAELNKVIKLVELEQIEKGAIAQEMAIIKAADEVMS